MAVNDSSVNASSVNSTAAGRRNFVYVSSECDIQVSGSFNGYRVRNYNIATSILSNVQDIYTNLDMYPVENTSITFLVQSLMKTAMEGFAHVTIDIDVEQDIQRIVDSIVYTTIEFIKDPMVNHLTIYRKGKPGIGFLQYSIVYYLTGQIIIKKDPYL